MNHVCRVECTSTCGIGVSPILGASSDIVELLELMSSFDALLCRLVWSSNERDNIISAAIPGQCE